MGRFGKRLSAEGKSLLYRQLAVMLMAGVSIERAFEILAEESELRRIKVFCASIRDDLAKGAPIEECLEKYPDIFYGSLIRLFKQEGGRESLLRVLYSLANTYDEAATFKAKLASILYYPAAAIGIAIIVTMVILVFVIPVFKEMFASFGSSLPTLTQLVVNIGDWVKGNITYILIAMAILVFLFVKNKQWLYRLAIIVPRLGPILKKLTITLFTKQLSIMLSVDTPFKQAMDYASGVVDNVLHAEKIRQMSERISEPKQLKEEMSFTGIFPKVTLEMVDAGQKSETLVNVLDEISYFYQKDIDRSLRRFTVTLEIVLIILLGVFIGGLVIAMYLPIFAISAGLL